MIIFANRFGLDQAQSNKVLGLGWAWSESKPFDTLFAFLEEFLKKVNSK